MIDVVITGTNGSGSASTTTAAVGPITPAAESYLLLMSGGGDRLKLMNGTDDFLLLGASGIPAGALLDLNDEPVLDLDMQYILPPA